MGQKAVISRLTGTLARAFLVILLIALPSLMLPGVNSDAAQIVALVGIFAAALVIFEYASTYPGLVEFRDAPPFNRIRFASLFVTVLLLTLLVRGAYAPSTLTNLIAAVGTLIGHAIDFPYSPVRLVVLMLPPGTSTENIALVRTSAGIAYLVSLLTLAIFLIILRIQGWPKQTGAFNVWVNLPTFDPTAGGDVVDRLERDARFNIALGFLLPFLTPAVIKAAAATFGSVSLMNPQTLIWTVAAWAFLPASLFMRGIAMGRIAAMIEHKRKLNGDQAERESTFAPA
ncbi:hypothetical protein [Ovoidimarina sediminis]|uniref:hypothetical protein n=1 Tax=Ovoidimarina sediminis TaxID=3079856 RepID=UPI0029060F10|nr:hypothetical protein [Rhodophyticola sp. MJ-SS7]MDU8942618.1 hypothetical protein [Rhodophyticola sp. MJ-SS7]